MADKRTEISAIGEFGLIARIKSNFSFKNTSTVLGIDDDAAVIDAGDKYLLVSTDMLLEGVHFDLAFTPLKHLGYKAVAVNVSDIAAMNGFPKQLTVSIGLSNRFSVEAVDALYEGIKMACEQIEELKELPGVAGVHLMAIEWEHKVPEIAEQAKVLPRPQVD